MHDQQLPTHQKRRPTGFTVALLLTLSAVAVLTAGASVPNPSESGSGPWINSTYTDECNGDLVCAEWPYEGSNISMVCCVDDPVVGTYQFEDCGQYVTHRVVN